MAWWPWAACSSTWSLEAKSDISAALRQEKVITSQDDPNRGSYLKSLTLRNAMNLAVVGFGLGDLVIGTGAISIVLWLIIVGLAVPVHYAVTRTHRDAVRA